jgi:hypothetical protein
LLNDEGALCDLERSSARKKALAELRVELRVVKQHKALIEFALQNVNIIKLCGWLAGWLPQLDD